MIYIIISHLQVLQRHLQLLHDRFVSSDAEDAAAAGGGGDAGEGGAVHRRDVPVSARHAPPRPTGARASGDRGPCRGAESSSPAARFGRRRPLPANPSPPP